MPLRRYEVVVYNFPLNEYVVEVFTATHHNTEDGVTRFYSDGNVIREYFDTIKRIVISPVDHTPQVSE